MGGRRTTIKKFASNRREARSGESGRKYLKIAPTIPVLCVSKRFRSARPTANENTCARFMEVSELGGPQDVSYRKGKRKYTER